MMNNDMAQQMQKLYERKAKDVESKLPWYKNPLKDYDIAPVVVLDKPFDAPSTDFLKLPKATRHTSTHAMFPEHDEPRLQAKLKPTATFPSPSHRHSTLPTDESKGTSPKPTVDAKLRYRGRVSWEANLLDSKSETSRMQATSPLRSPKKAATTTQLSPLKSVLQHSVGDRKSALVESAEHDQLLQHMLRHDDEIDALLSKYAIAQATKVGARDSAIAAYAVRPRMYTFSDPPPQVNTELDPSAPSTPVVARRRFALQVDNSVSDDEDGNDDDEADEDEEAAAQDQLKATYFGSPAKDKFYATYTKMHHKTQCFSAIASKASAPETLVSEYSFKPVVHAHRLERVATENEIKLSPRTLFLSDCLASTDLPLALPLLLRKHHTTSFDFSYQSLGDKFIVQFASALRDVPFVEEINVCDNRLSDRALNKLLRALEAKPNLTKLNISQNEIGAASASTLKHYIGSTLCTVTHLSICNADIDDHECAAFMSAFESNKSVVDLRLSRNRIGEAENLNVVQPDLITGGEAIGNMLNVNLTLTHLDLAWNLLRLASGVTLANALRLNYNLYEINVAYNALGDAGAMAFGQSLEVNKSLRVLNLSYNNIRCKGASVIASALSRTNATLHKLILDGNNIGKEGGRILMYAMVQNGTPSGCSISMKACSLNDHSNQTTFDPMEPGGVYCLNCADPYESMIAHELLRLAATKRGCTFAQLLHRPTKETPLKQAHPIKLVPPPRTLKSALDITFTDIDKDKSGTVDIGELQTVLRELGFHPTPAQAQSLFEQMDADRSGAIEPCELTSDLFHAVYHIIDTNQSGTIDMNELRAAFHLLGAAPTERDVQSAMKIYDVDGSGTIEEDEFVELLKNQVIQRVQMNAQDRIVASLALREEGSGAVWKVPASGILDITFSYERELMSEREIIASYGLSERGLQQLVKTVVDGKVEQQHQELLGAAVDNTDIRMSAEQAMVLMETCGELQEARRVGSVAKMLPQLVSSKEAHMLVKHTLTVRERYHLRSRMGSLYFPIMGLPTAKYELDLSRPQDRQAVMKLAEIAQAEKQFSKTRSCRGDTSQHGNWENFRNELFDGKPVVLTSAFFQNVPSKGKLEFDYVSTSRPKRGTKPMSTRRFQQLVQQIGRESSVELQRPKMPLLTVRQRWGLVRNAVRHRKMKAWLHRVTEVFHIRHITFESVRDKLFQIETAIGDRWLSVNQAHEIIDCMPTLHHGKAEAVRVLFARIIDLENFATILDALSLPEQKEVARSLGWLNILNPKVPDRYYELDLAVRDERELAKIYVALAVTEPGENWINETFAWQRSEPPIPGWQLPISWTKEDGGPEDGPRRAGWLTLEYTSAPENGCNPVWAIRQELQTRVLCGTRLYL
ncbi:hypothetical protein SDRG_05733 [Saprolegnia diclina VS20]|uniref:EF-hand domain-containing protein n=1 Tax=Saprolegnia diclina (strain VS20) TaxID=1156394 RepID=T0QSD8_SAPDV|nr:hypothetical protein SDRG_05733 [Saprolegnia diclina VS20]EQC36905.1 hypothetical protein SDRG_05733 [Saprolegnia diclina VS20]|eukprot:XP_008609686.1 hypothetical protein SDRG_05733 [Saprolegnia diclina VS20]